MVIEGPTGSLSGGPTAGLLFEFGPVEATADVVFRTGLVGSHPYEWSE